jgi:hypothetical protein
VFKPDKKLQRWYNRFNKLYFDGQLPLDVQVGFNELEGMYGTLAVNIWTSEEDGLEHRVLQIHIDPDKHHGSEQLKLTLLHECCHVKLIPWRFHGRRFQEEMKRLAGRDAFKELW